MPKCKNVIKNEVCQGCLTNGRKLLPIKDYLHLYKKLMEDVLMEEIEIKRAPQMCSECRSFFRNVRKFQKRAKQAYEMLVTKIDLGVVEKQTHEPHLSAHTTFSSDVPFTNYELLDDAIKDNSSDDNVESEKNIKTDDKKNEELKSEIDVEGIKEEEKDDIKIEYDCLETESVTEGVDFTDDIDIEADVKEEIEINKNELGKLIKFEKAKLSRKEKYKLFKKMDYRSFKKVCVEIKIDEDERQRCLQTVRETKEYLNARYKCERCATVYGTRDKYDAHLRAYHSQLNEFECELCGARLVNKVTLARHVHSHGRKHACSLCGYERVGRRAVVAHLARAHHIAYECRECGLRFQKRYKDFYRHYKYMHKSFVCDYCGFRATYKKRLIVHIRAKHSDNVCKYCNKRYVVYHSLTRHIALRHTRQVTDESYCVECNVQFDNVTLYDRHLKTSVKHKPKTVFQCMECPNVYAKKTAMMNHYRYIHLQKTNYYCDKCSRYFLNGFRLRTHIATYHNNIRAPKNKICSYCGRGFVTNRILDNHIRTHTGERPFACTHCTATFAQKTALVTHARAIHKVMMRYSSKE